MAKYVKQDLFDYMAVTAAKLSASGKSDIKRVAADMELMHKEYSDSHLAQDICVASQMINDRAGSLVSTNFDEAMSVYQYMIQNFHTTGKRKRKLFRGTFFNKERTEIRDKPVQCIKNLAIYGLLLQGGKVKI